MTSFTTVQFANALVADAERRWLYGHPYRSDASERAFIGIRVARRVARRNERGRRSRAVMPAARRGLAA
jgi:hypothetical protein